MTPEREWVEEIVDAFHKAGKPVFMKDSLIPVVGEYGIIREFPWDGTAHEEESKR